MSVATCPAPAVLERLYLGGMPEQEVEALEEHVLHCATCLDRVNKLSLTQDSLAGVLRDDTQCDALDCGLVVEDLMKKLEALRPATARSQPQGTPMIAFPCSGCQKPLQVKDTFAGKKVSCPACSQVTVVPAHAAVALAANDDLRTLPPAPAQADEGAPPPVSNPDGTLALEPRDTDRDSSLTAFLAPPQAEGELGRLGKYRILKILGHGGMGVVYKAEDPKLKRSVALKAMLPTLAASASAGKRFLREAEAMAAVEHDHIVRIYQVDEDRGVPFLAMEFLKGEALDQRLKREDRLPLADVLRLGREIAEGLAAAHATGLIHRDIKPGNIWLEAPRNRVKILDFGLARATSQDSSLTQQGAIIGTPAYMAPEQARGDAIDARCDLFSLGVVLYRLCSGQQPFPGNDTVSTLMAVAMHEPAPPITLNAELPPELSDLVMQLLEKDPARRIASAAVVVEVLQSMEKQLARVQESQDHTLALNSAAAKRAAVPSKQGSAAASAKAPSPPRRRGLVLVAAAAGGLALVVAGIVLFWQTPSGTVRIEINDPDIQVLFDKDGPNFKGVDKHELKITPGEHALHVKRGNLEFDTDKFVVKRGETITLKVEWFQDRKLQVMQERNVLGAKELPKVARAPLDPAWLKAVAAMEAKDQVEAVKAELMKRNPEFDAKGFWSKTEFRVVTTLEVPSDNVTDISPVQALTGLRTLYCIASAKGKRQLADLSPLKDMPLTELSIYRTSVSDLSPLKNMKLTRLNCAESLVSDLSPLKDVPLTHLDCGNTKVSDLKPLQDMKLITFFANNTWVSDLAPLQGMPLTEIVCQGTPVADLSPLKDMKLTRLWIFNTKVTDLSPLRGMPLKEFTCRFKAERDTEILRSLTTLKRINEKAAADFWRELGLAPATFPPLDPAWLKMVAAMPAKEQVEAVKAELMKRNPDFNGTMTHKLDKDGVVELEFLTDKVIDISPVRALPGLLKLVIRCRNRNGKLADLAPLKDMKLTHLDCAGTQVSDLSPLKVMKLTFLNCGNTPVSDLSPLKGIKLEYLRCSGTKATDLSPLKDMKLTNLNCDETKVSDLSPLKDMKLVALGFSSTNVTDLALLKGMPLHTIRCDFKPYRDTEILLSIKALKTINEKPVAEFWKEVDAQRAAFDTWLKQVAALPAQEQVEAVKAELVKRNPGFDGKIVSHGIEGGVVTSLDFRTHNVTDISPVRALIGLTRLICSDAGGTGAQLADLSPLKDMKLTTLSFSNTKVSDLSPLRGMPLAILYCNSTPVSDLSPLKDMKLTALFCDHTQAADLSLLKGMPLKTLHCDFVPKRDTENLRSMPTLEAINNRSAQELWKEVNAKKVEQDP